MKSKILILVLALSLVSVFDVHAQKRRFKFSYEGDSDASDFTWFWERKPTLELFAGFSGVSGNAFGTPFRDANSLELQLGYTRLAAKGYSTSILNYEYQYIFLGNTSSDYGVVPFEKNIAGLKSDLWRAGIGMQSGYAYRIGHASAIIPYYGAAVAWSQFNAKDWPSDAAGQAELGLYTNAVRFGTVAEGGVKFQFLPVVMLNVGYERALVFPRYLFWKHFGSVILEGAGQSGLDAFIKQVYQSSPAAAPIVNFLLKNGFSFAIYQLRREKMNWPFESASPLTTSTFKVGLSASF